MTILTIEGQAHDLTRALREATIGDLRDLKRATISDGSKGLSVAKIGRALDDLGDALRGLSEDASWEDLDRVIVEFFDDIDHLDAYAGMVFLCKRKAGEEITFADALAVELSAVKFAADPADEEEEADPKDPRTLEDEGPEAEA